MSANRPGAGSSTSVRSWWRVRRSFRYWTSSAWQRRQPSTWRRRARSAGATPSTITGRARDTSSHRMGGLLSLHREQTLAQPAPGPMEPHLGSRLTDPELVGDGLVGQVVHVPEYDDRPQALGQVL